MSKIFIEKGDITEQKVDAIINAANSELLHGGGMAAVIVEAGGQIIQEQSNKIAPIPLGEAAVTEAGKLPCKYVIHAASMKLGELTSEDNLISSIKNGLLRAKELGIKSLAIPAIGTGIGEFPFDTFSQIAIKEVNEFIQNYDQIEKVVFVFSSDVNFNKFQSIYQSKL
ncbi:MAG: macro domain-containing protein [bacterium]|nr:macro domain-containing protein [bacterium]